MDLVIAIAALCATQTLDSVHASAQALTCQQYYVECYSKKYVATASPWKLMDCIKEKKQ